MKKHPASILMTAALLGAGFTGTAEAQRSYRASTQAGTHVPKQQDGSQPLFPGLAHRPDRSGPGMTAPPPGAAERAVRQKLARQSVVGTGGHIEVTKSTAVDDVITVTSESPLLDERRISTGATINAGELEKIPRAPRDPWDFLQHTPGVNDHGTMNGPDQPVIIPGVNPPRVAGGGDAIVLGNISQRKPISTPTISTRGGTGAGFPLPPKPIMTIPPRSPRPGWGTSAAATQPSNAVGQGSRILFLHDERSGPKSGGLVRAVLAHRTHRSAAEE